MRLQQGRQLSPRPNGAKEAHQQAGISDGSQGADQDPNGVSDDLYARLARHFTPGQLVALTAFGGLMVATNLFNNALRVDLDDYLKPYRRPPAAT